MTYLPVEQNGLINLDVLKAAMRPETVLVSIMGVNNEIGVIQPMKEIGQLCRANKTFFHSDIAQMTGKVPINVDELGLDAASISSHKVIICLLLRHVTFDLMFFLPKIYGPKGMGALYVRRKPRVKLEPLFSGGGQERGMRSGTLAPALCVGMGTAAKLCREDMEIDTAWVTYLSNKLRECVISSVISLLRISIYFNVFLLPISAASCPASPRWC